MSGQQTAAARAHTSLSHAHTLLIHADYHRFILHQHMSTPHHHMLAVPCLHLAITCSYLTITCSHLTITCFEMSAGLQGNKIPRQYMLHCVACIILVRCSGPQSSRHRFSDKSFNQVILLMSSTTAGLTLKVQHVKTVLGF